VLRRTYSKSVTSEVIVRAVVSRPIAGGQIEEDFLQTVLCQVCFQFLGFESRGKQILDVGGTGRASQSEACHEGRLGGEQGEVGGEFRHARSLGGGLCKGSLQGLGWGAEEKADQGTAEAGGEAGDDA
jgi:hypothetical protein